MKMEHKYNDAQCKKIALAWWNKKKTITQLMMEALGRPNAPHIYSIICRGLRKAKDDGVEL